MNAIRGTAQQVDLDGTAVGAPVPLNNLGAQPSSAQYCQNMNLDYANGEYLKKITVKADANIARVVTLETSASPPQTLVVGNNVGGTTETEVTFESDE